MIRIIKSILILITVAFLLLSFLLIYDMTDFDTSYVNRKALEIDVKNINSRHSKKIISFLRSNYITFSIKISKKAKERWNIESEEKRREYPEYKIIKAKKNNFSKPIYTKENYKNYSNWLRSHGNNFSTRFSGLKIINRKNIEKLELVWTYTSNDSLGREIQANPVVENGIIYTPTPGNSVVAINGINGKELWRFRIEKGTAARRGLLVWKNNLEETSRIFFTNNRNKLIALNAKSGKKIKSFGNEGEINIGVSPIAPLIIKNYLIIVDTKSVIKIYDAINGKLLWKYFLKEPKNSLIFANFNKGSPWGGISADNQREILFLTTGNPAPWHVGTDRPGDNLYSNSIVAIDIKNRKKLWHFQEISHDLWNQDMAAAPILTTIKKNNQEIDVVVAISKLGNTFILDRVSGEPIFDVVMKRAPTSKIPGERTSVYQPYIKLPEPICRNEFKKEYITNIGEKNYLHISSILQNANYGFPSPFEIGKKGIQIASCVRWSGASIDTNKNRMYVSADQKPYLAEIKVNNKYKHSYHSIFKNLTDLDGFPAITPPWGTLTSLDLNTGKIVWQVPLGEYEALTKKGFPITGTPNRSGATATDGGLVFVSGTLDYKIRAFDSDNGKELWSYKMPFIGSAAPTTYMVNDKQYVIIPAFENLDGLNGDKLLAFSIK